MDLKDNGINMWEEEKITSFREKLLAWYDANKRDLPWRKTQDPYKKALKSLGGLGLLLEGPQHAESCPANHGGPWGCFPIKL